MKKVNDGFNTIPITEYKPETKKHEAGSGKSALVCITIILLFIVIFMICVRMDVGGFGSATLRPVLKDVPLLNKILPPATDEEVAAESGYSSLSQAVTKIGELEKEIEALKTAQNTAEGDNSDTAALQSRIQELENQVATLKVYEDNQKNFEATKEDFYREVVYNDNVDVSDYTKWYESMNEDTAAKLYKEAVKTEETDAKNKELAEAYSHMKPEKAAKILENMTADLDTVVNILDAMSAKDRGEIMGEMSSAYAAKITKKMSY